MKSALISIFFLLLWSSLVAQDTGYRRPPADVVAIVETPPTPFAGISPNKDAMMLVNYNPDPGIATMAQPFLKLGGIRVNPTLNSRQRITEYTDITIHWLFENNTAKIRLPTGVRPSAVPSWSPDGKKIAFPVDVADGVELWVANTKTGDARRMDNIRLNEVLMSAYSWMEDSEHLMVRAVPPGRGPAPVSPSVPSGPIIEETSGKLSKLMTFQDLLRNEFDEKLFEYYGTSQLIKVNTLTGKQTPFGKPALYTGVNWSPDEKYVLVSFVRKPFSYRVPYGSFSRKTEVWDALGNVIHTVVDLPVTDEIPTQGVVTGPRSVSWQTLHPSKLVWVEALDGGDPKKVVPHRDRLMTLNAPFNSEPVELDKIKNRYSGITWTHQADVGLMTDYDRDRRWNTSMLINLNDRNYRDTVFDLSVNDDYNDPGNPVMVRLPNLEYVIAHEGDWYFYNNAGASPEGNFPKLDLINFTTGEKKTVWESPGNMFAQFISFAGPGFDQFIIRKESKTEVPNFFLVNRKNKSEKQLTFFKDPAPQLTGIDKKLVTYKRADGVPLSGTLMLPPGYKAGQKLPLFIWAYPVEYSDMNTAGQVRGSDNTFTFLRGDNPAFFLTQGYAVLMNATIPIVGDPETMNDSFIEQAVSSGRAAIDYLDSLGIIDRERVGVGGHSYGAFMTANLLAHSDDYAFGIARSGAFNRTLTPFGFQSERRSFWEAKDVYMNVSPFTHADKINEPLLIIHGEADNNPGTHTFQSERLYQAIKGTGGTARLVLLPHESHGYRAKESLLHVLAEMFDWAEKYGSIQTVRP